MQSVLKRTRKEKIRNMSVNRHKKNLTLFFFAAFLFILMVAPSFVCGAEKIQKIQPKAQQKKQSQKPQALPAQKEVAINDANLMAHQKKVEDLVGKGDFNGALKIMLKINDYAKEVLSTVKNIKTEYEKAADDPKTSLKDKEDLFIKMRGLDQLIPRYRNYYEASTFNLGYMYSKLGETEKARKYLTEFLQMTPYAAGRDSQWVKAKTLLLELYSLEGEF